MPQSTQSTSTARRKRFTILGLTMILVVIPFCLYYLFFVSSQTTYFSNRNFRVLGEIGEHISSEIDNLATNLVNVATKATQDKTTGKGKKAVSDIIKEAANLVPDFKEKVSYEPLQRAGTDRVSSKQDASNPGSNGDAERRSATSEGQRSVAPESPATGTEPVILSVKSQAGSFSLYLEYRNTSRNLEGTFSVASDLKTQFEPLVSRYVIDELNETKERLFDEVLVAEQETGRVIFQRGPAGLSVVTLDSFLNKRGANLELKLADQSSTLADVQLAGTDYKLFLQPVRLTHSASLDKNQPGTRWVVCGLTRTDHFREQTFSVSYTVLISFVFLVLLTALSWPLLRLKLMGPKDRMRRADLRLTVLSALLGTALVTFIVLDVLTYFTLENTLDHHLLQLSEDIDGNFRRELGSALAQLRQFNDGITAPARKENSGPASGIQEAEGAVGDLLRSIVAPHLEAHPNGTPTFSRKTNILASGSPALSDSGQATIKWDDAHYPYFNSATWNDPSGLQRIKWTTWNDTTAFLKVSAREFFTNARDGKLWRLNQTTSDSDYCVELLRSRLTGENVAVVATRVPNSTWVSNLDTRLLSLMGTALPAFYGYAVIDGNGKVIFHSDEVKNLEEQFFAECENDSELRAAVLSRTDRLIDTNYLGRGHRLYVSPLSHTPWMLVVFRDVQAARTMRLEMLTLSLVPYFGLALLLIVLTAAISEIYLWREGQEITWLWPCAKRAGRYKLLIVLYVCIVLVFAAALIIENGWFLVACCFALPLVATVLAMWILGRNTWELLVAPAEWIFKKALAGYARTSSIVKKVYPQGKKWVKGEGSSQPSQGFDKKVAYRTSYAIALAGLLTIVSVLPAFGFFLVARNFEVRLMVKHGLVSLAKAIEQRTQRVDSQYASVKIGDQQNRETAKETKDAFLKKRLDLSPVIPNLDVYNSFFFGTTVGGSPQDLVDESPGRIDSMLAWIRPLYNQSCIETQELSRGSSSDWLWRWKQDRDGRIYLEKDRDARLRETSVVLKSGTAALVTPNTPWRWIRVILSIALLGILPYGLVRFVARRFFLLDMDVPPREPVIVGSYVYIQSSGRVRKNHWDGYEYHDLSKVKDWRNLSDQLKSEAIAQPEPVVVSNNFVRSEVHPLKGVVLDNFEQGVVLDNFEHCMDDPAASREKLLAVECFLAERRTVVVASTKEPLDFPFKPKPSCPDGATAAQFSIITVPRHAGPAGSNNGKVETPLSQPASRNEKQNGAAEGKEEPQVPPLSQTDTQARWARVFASLPTVFAHDGSSDHFVDDNLYLLSALKTERPWSYIEDIGKAMVEKDEPEGKKCSDPWEAEEIISQVVERGRAYHQSLWDTCEEGQRCTLIQLAQDGMISPKNKHVRRLLRRRLVVSDPALRLMDESFRRFVSSVAHKEDVEAWRQQEGGSAWELLKTPLLLILVSVALFLFVTQKEVYDSTITFMSAITGGIALVFRLLGMIHGRDKGGVGGVPN